MIDLSTAIPEPVINRHAELASDWKQEAFRYRVTMPGSDGQPMLRAGFVLRSDAAEYADNNASPAYPFSVWDSITGELLEIAVYPRPSGPYSVTVESPETESVPVTCEVA